MSEDGKGEARNERGVGADECGVAASSGAAAPAGAAPSPSHPGTSAPTSIPGQAAGGEGESSPVDSDAAAGFPQAPEGNGAPSVSRSLLQGFAYGLLSTALLTVLFMLYARDSAIRSYMTFSGWVFYVSAAIPHAALVALVGWLLAYVPSAAVLRRPRLALGLSTAFTAAAALAVFINSYVYGLYRFHIDGLVLDMLFSSGAGDVFSFGPGVFAQAAVALAALVGAAVGLSRLSGRCAAALGWKRSLAISGAIFLMAVGAQAAHVASAATMKNTVVMKCAKVLPHYYPLTLNHFLIQHGIIEDVPWSKEEGKNMASGDVDYPKAPVSYVRPEAPPNIIHIAIDSWRSTAIDGEMTPSILAFTQGKADWFQDHLSSSNRTRGSLFGVFFGLTPYNWEDFQESGVRPLLLDQMKAEGYRMKFYPSATLLNPPIAQVLFGDIPDFPEKTPGKTSYDRDVRITEDFLADLDGLAQGSAAGTPFYAFVFYDMPHTADIPEEKTRHFQPSWTAPDYTALHNDTDPTEFYNLYRNSVLETDILVGQVLKAIEEKGLLENSIVIIQGDHGQEFNDSHKNYWGHGSAFSEAQVRTPLIYHAPGQSEGRAFRHRTTHYDLVPTLMSKALGVANPPGDYSMGHSLWDAEADRNWHPMGEHKKRAFLVNDGEGGWTIIRRLSTGGVEVLDRHLDDVPGYQVDYKAMGERLKALRSFYK